MSLSHTLICVCDQQDDQSNSEQMLSDSSLKHLYFRFEQ